MKKKDDPGKFNFKWQEDEWRAEMANRAEERRRYIAGLFSLPSNNLSEPDYLIEGFLPLGYMAVLAGDPKIGKTCLATAIAASIALGENFAGLRTKQGGVLWLSLEESPQERASAIGSLVHLKSVSPEWTDEQNEARKEVFGPPLSDFAQMPLYTCYQPLAIDTTDGLDALDTWVSQARAKLIVVDPLHAAHSGRSLNDGWAARRTLQPLKQFCARRQVSALVLHHLGSRNGKPRVAENSQISAVASMYMLLSELFELPNLPNLPSPSSMGRGRGWGESMSDKSDSPTANKGKTFQLICRGRGSFANRTWLFNSKSPSHFEIAHSDGYVIPNRTESIRNAIIRLLGDGRAYTSKLICAHLRHYTKGAVLNVMTDLKKRGILMRDSSKGRAPSFKVNFIQAEIHGYQRENTP